MTERATRKSFLVFDLESRDRGSRGSGFERPFLIGLYDGSRYVTVLIPAATKQAQEAP